MKKVGLIFGGRTAEHRVSVASARTIARGLEEAGHEVVPLPIGPDGGWLSARQGRYALEGRIDQLPVSGQPIRSTLNRLLEVEVDVVFPTIHGTWGEDGTLQGFCEILDLPYVGAGVATSAIAMDKVLCKELLARRGIPVVDAEVVTSAELGTNEGTASALDRAARLPRPLFVKPAVGGSSVGVYRVGDGDDLEAALRDALRFDDTVLVERGVVGRELECSVLGLTTIEASVLGEIVSGRDFYDYADKYIDDGAQLIAPANVEATLANTLRDVAVSAFRAIGGTGMARVDFLVEEGAYWVNEINTLPGFTDISMYPRLWGVSGVPLADLVDRLVVIALERHKRREKLDAGIKSWIASLESR